MLINANALSIPLANKSVHTIVTSPPYYGLRDYGVDGQLGLEQTPDAYIANLVEVFRECKRILRDDGTLWVNIGDSYCGTGDKGEWTDPKYADGRNGQKVALNKKIDGLKPKDLIGIPWMLAFALRADGWYLRQDIIWAKPNPMPESVKDRCTKSHEYIFLLSKSAKYYYDSEAVKEPSKNPQDDLRRIKADKEKKYNVKAMQWNTKYKNLQPDGQQPNTMHLNRLEGNEYMSPVRNKRDVWTVTTKPYKGAHYATFNPDLIKPCILAGAPETCCAKCGAPYERVVERETIWRDRPNQYTSYREINGQPDQRKAGSQTKTTGYQPTCSCNAGTSSGIVFDPFVGSGTTVATAIQLGRKGIGLDISYKYLQENAKVRVELAELPLLNLIGQY